MAHCFVEEAEKILDKEFPVLNKGFVRLVDYMGSDERIVQAARVSYGKGTKSVREDKGLITYLLRNDHTSPFEQVVFTFHCKMPLFVARQWIRHRTARLNEISGRYSVMNDDFYIPELADISFQSSDNKQGRSEEEVPEEIKKKVIELFKEDQKRVYSNYESLLEQDIARELARINLPLSLYTEWYWQIDLHNLFHFLRLRMDAHAQKEIRVYAEAMYQAASTVCPLAFEAFDQYIKGSVRFSRDELKALSRMLEGEEHGLKGRDKTLFESKLSEGRQL
ncbi:FAD-dependent thymidylate synthase [Spirochaeta isovalerica]|uniref:Flavin-dependent thymidylate synthase n=1 Tax=Spirochaeta isovalerica TaxID=150 RepID=A0A841RE24_9SPIO|nr:FAD-dependent thymidylate synthase [Spirochaeta isovalerica]MBB6482315.1 thymidylate synthase (FAD) [Spirochaeta isovalerica]